MPGKQLSICKAQINNQLTLKWLFFWLAIPKNIQERDIFVIFPLKNLPFVAWFLKNKNISPRE